ncbi:MAG: Mitochondrial porin [Pleopsidium flavum]|nr:MAG: Mitochondrial porin [Pleopsidium flavum]KAI9879992.1 MAG: Mitochondrial porin [Pleopsidium flavum]
MAVPAFSDIAKPSNDVRFAFATVGTSGVIGNGQLTYQLTASEQGLLPHRRSWNNQIEAKYSDAPTGIHLNYLHFFIYTPLDASKFINHQIILSNGQAALLMFYRRAGLTLTQAWTTANALDTKVELDNTITKGLKAELLTHFYPHTQGKGAKLNLHFKQPNFHARAFFDLLKGPTANVDAVLGHEGFLVGAEAGYDVQKAAITRYSAAVGYTMPEYTAAITATNSLSVFSASYYHKVNSQVEAGAKATWDSKGSNNVGLEVASKYRLDPTSFAKAKINDRGIAAVAYNVDLRPGVKLGLGASFDTQNLTEAAHKVGASFTFDA